MDQAASALDGLRIMIHPGDGWDNQTGSDRIGPLLVTYCFLAFLPMVGRALGHWFQGGCWSPAGAMLEGVFYSAMAFVLVLMLGLVLGALADRFTSGSRITQVVTLSFLASTPLWIGGALFAVPVPIFQPFLIAILLAYFAFLLFTGAHRFLGAKPEQASLLISLLFGVWSLLFVLILHVGLPTLMQWRC